MEINKKSSMPTWKLALIGAGTSLCIAAVGLGCWYLSARVLPEVSSSSGNNKPNDGLFKITEGFGQDLKYGFIDKTGKIVISPQFESVGSFHGGLAQIGINGSTGYINKEGKIVINPQFKACTPFSQGLALVSTSDLMGYIDKSGKYVWQRSIVKNQSGE